MAYKKNVATQFFCFQGVDSSSGGIKSGVTWTVRRCIDGTFAAGGGTVTEDGTTGWYKFAMTQADTNGNDISFNFTGTGAVPQTVNILTDGAPNDVNVTTISGTAQTARDIGASVLVGDKTGFSLTQTFPSNFASLAISAGGLASADVKQMNATTVNGAGTAGNLWRG